MNMIVALNRLTEIFYRIYNTLGYGFSREVYVRAFMVELENMDMEYRRDYAVKVYYEGVIVGSFEADLLVNGGIMIMIQADPNLDEALESRMENVLSATCCGAGLLYNFGIAPDVCRKMGQVRGFNKGEEVPFSACA